MNNKDLARHVARGVFATVDLPTFGDKAQRIAFKGGEYPDRETDLGGLNEAALAGVIYRLLEAYKIHEPQVRPTDFTGKPIEARGL